jgi:hypothetical protein
VQDAIQVWAQAAARAVEKRVGEARVALAGVRLRLTDEHAVAVEFVRAEELADHVALRNAILLGRYRGMRVLTSPDGKLAFAAAGDAGIEALVNALQTRLGDTSWPVLVSGPGDATQRARVHFGPDRFEALFGPEPVTYPQVSAAPTSRAELVELVRAFALPEWIAQQARWGLALLPDGSGRSHLGGRPALPDGTWPINDGRGLTHLASIALEELPGIEGRERLPGPWSSSPISAKSTKAGDPPTATIP